MNTKPIDDPVGHALASTETKENESRSFWLNLAMRGYTVRGTVGRVTDTTIELFEWAPSITVAGIPSDTWQQVPAQPRYIARHMVESAQVVYFDE